MITTYSDFFYFRAFLNYNFLKTIPFILLFFLNTAKLMKMGRMRKYRRSRRRQMRRRRKLRRRRKMSIVYVK